MVDIELVLLDDVVGRALEGLEARYQDVGEFQETPRSRVVLVVASEDLLGDDLA
jgi:hypothetical protein